MELDDFKSLLKIKLEEQAPSRSVRELEQSIHRKTVSLLDKIKRSILFEMVMSLLVAAVAARVSWHHHSLSTRFFGIAILVFCILFIVYLAALYKKILFSEKASPSVRERLRQIIDILQRFTRFYFRFSIGFLPVAFILGLVSGYADIMQQPVLAINFRWARAIAVYIVFFIGWSALAGVFSKWYIKKLYGNYLAGIRNQLEDLENG